MDAVWKFVADLLGAIGPAALAVLTLAIVGLLAGAVGFGTAERLTPSYEHAARCEKCGAKGGHGPLVKRLVATLSSCASAFLLNYGGAIPGFTWGPKSWAGALIAGVGGSALAEWLHDNPNKITALIMRKPAAPQKEAP